MSRLKFEDIDEWTPSSISIVDVPAHPLCKFEVYDDDTEFVKKSIEIQNEGEIMVEPQNKEETQMMTVSEGFFERMLNRVVGKSEEAPEKPPIKEEPKKETDISALVARIEKLEAEVAELKKEEKPKEEEKPEAPAEAVAKSESEGETSEATGETTEESEPKVVMKSKSLDPDTITTSAESDKSLVERAGRKTNGMSW